MTNYQRKNYINFSDPPCILSYAAVGGKKEEKGPLGRQFDRIISDGRYGKKSWEQGESCMQQETIRLALKKAGKSAEEMDLMICGDLINQCIASAYCARELGIPFAGIYNACASMAEGLALSAALTGSGFMDQIVCAASSHFCTAERQYRYPLEYGGQRCPSTQWTATACGAVVVGRSGGSVKIREAFLGRAVDFGISDLSNMGAAMAPAAADTLCHFLQQTKTDTEDYDAVITGDLGRIGSELFAALLENEGICLKNRHFDCGTLLYAQNQDVHAGGSGSGCCASVLCCELLPRLERGDWKNILFLATGALMSPLSIQQGESIPGICHLLHLSA